MSAKKCGGKVFFLEEKNSIEGQLGRKKGGRKKKINRRNDTAVGRKLDFPGGRCEDCGVGEDYINGDPIDGYVGGDGGGRRRQWRWRVG